MKQISQHLTDRAGSLKFIRIDKHLHYTTAPQQTVYGRVRGRAMS